MTDDAGDALARRRVAFQVGDEGILAQVGADLVVAAQAEIAIRPVGQFVDLVVQRQVDGAELGIGVLGD